MKQEYIKTLRFLKSILPLFWLSTTVMMLTVAITGFALLKSPSQLSSVNEYIQSIFVGKGLMETQGFSLAFGLICNNLVACGWIMALGFIPFLFLPLLVLAFNGGLIGAVCAVFFYTGVGNVATLAAGLVPHGIFEFPAILLATALGMHLCWQIIRMFTRHTVSIKTVILNIFRTYVLIVFPLLVAAGFMEAFVTPIIMGMTI